MPTRWLCFTSLLLLAGAPARTETLEAVPKGDHEPLLRLEAGGPTAFVTGLAFSPDGGTLYAAGFDKAVRVWTINARTGKFVLDQSAYRVPIGPGLEGGALNALTLSPDGSWLAAAGLGLTRGGAGFRMPGWILPVIGGLNAEMRRDQGVIYVFNTRDGTVRLLRGHKGPVSCLAFAPARENVPPLLVSAAREWDDKKNKHVGAVLLWDLDKAAAIADAVLPDSVTTPALAVQPTGSGVKELRVAVAWEDGLFRLWDIRSGKVFRAEDGKYNNTTAYLPDQAGVLTGSANRLQVWDVRGGQPQTGRRIRLPGTESVAYFPRALALCSSHVGGKPDHAAAVLRRVTRTEEEDWLYLFGLDPGNLGTIKARARLWRGSGNRPVLAAGPRGQHLAVAGNQDHAIRIYSIPDLLNGRDEPLQELRSAGTTMRHVQFVSKGQDLGLLLSGQPVQVPGTHDRVAVRGGLVFDFTKRSLTPEQGGWKSAEPTSGGWQHELSQIDEAKDDNGRVPQRSFALVVYQAGRRVGRTELNEIGDVSAYALLPSQPRLPVPLLAIAHRDKYLQPWLGLYDAASGEQVRQCTGHLDRIRALTFSGDGKLLASASDDQTVCVWSLTDLDRILKQRGMLKGVAVLEQGNELVVGQLEEKNLARENRGKLKEGNVVEGTVDGGKLRRLSSAIEFYDALWRAQPGKALVLRIRDSQGRKQDVPLLVSQGIDERKPLCSLFLAPKEKLEKWDWIGWSPIGFYEGSDREAERYVGWHFNTGKRDQPTSFALADQYRKQYYREGILKRLIEEGELPKQEPAKPLPRPNMTLWIDEAGLDPEKVDGRILLHQPRATLKLAINNFPPEKVAAVTFHVDGGTPRESAPDFGQIRSANLALERGPHEVRAVLRTLEAEPNNYQAQLSLVYLPPPPKVTCQLPRRQVVDEPKFRFRAQVGAGLSGQPIVVRLLHKHNDELVRESDASARPEIDQDFQLQPGENLFEVVAVNKEASRQYAALETNRQIWSVTYQKKDPPSILLSSVVTMPGESETGRALEIEPGKPVIVDTPKIQLEGRIKALGKLAEANGKLGGAAVQSFTNFEPHKVPAFAIRETLTLEPGSQKFRASAKTDGGYESEAVLTIEYRPRLPRLVLTSPRPETVLYEGQDSREVQLEGSLELPPHPTDFTVVVLVNGQTLADRPTLEMPMRKLTARVPLHFGDNRIQFQLANRWNVTSLSEATLVRYLRPPRHLHFGPPQAGMKLLTDPLLPRWVTPPGVPQVADKHLIDLVARLHSALPLTFVQAEVNGRKIAEPQTVPPARTQEAIWTVRLKEVPLDLGANVVRLWASNEDGRCREPGTMMILYRPPEPPPPPPELEILDPRRDITVDSAQYTIQYRVRSKSRFRRVELRRGEQVLGAADVAGLKEDAEGFVEVKQATAVKLLPGANVLQVWAVNAGGEREAAVTLSYVYQPVVLFVDQLELRRQPSQFFPADKRENNRLVFTEVPDGKLWLHGRVHWVDERDERLKMPTQVLVYTNGFKHIIELQPWTGKGLDRAFAVEIQLTRAKDNKVEIEVPDLPQEEGKSHEFSVDCRKPVPRKQRLHVLIVGNGEKDERKLTERVLNALQATPLSNGQFKTPAFAEGYLHGVLAGEHVDSLKIWPGLVRIRKQLSLRRKGDLASDVVLVYYQGGEADWSRISYDNLANFFAGTPGAQVLLLDVSRDVASQASPPSAGAEASARGPDDSHVGMFHYVWLDRAQAPAEDARLLADLQEALSRVGKLRDVAHTIDGKFKWNAEDPKWGVSRKYPEALIYQRRFPERLLDLSIGAHP